MKRLLGLSFALILAAGVARAEDAMRTNPKPVDAPSPRYPAELADTGTSGTAVVDFVVKADGTVDDIVVTSADHAAFGAAAVDALRSWRFEPATRNGKPADIRVSLPFRFMPPFEQIVNAAMKRKVFLSLSEPVLSQKEFGKRIRIKNRVAPLYPKQLAGSGKEAKVKVQFVITPDGNTVNPKIVGEAPPEFVLAAIRTVALTTFEPPVKDGKPVYVERMTTLDFSQSPPRQARRAGGGGGGGGGDDFGGGGFGGGGGGGGDDY